MENEVPVPSLRPHPDLCSDARSVLTPVLSARWLIRESSPDKAPRVQELYWVLEFCMIGAGPCHDPLSFLHYSESLYTVYLNLKSTGHTLFTNLKRRIVVVDELTPYLVERKTGPPLSSLKQEKPQSPGQAWSREATKVQAIPIPCSQNFCQIAKDFYLRITKAVVLR